MSLITIIVVIVAIAAALVVFLVEDAFEKLVDWLFGLVGLESDRGPLTAKAVVEGDRTVLTLVNQGKHKMTLVSVEGRDSNNKQCFPVPYVTEADLLAPQPEEHARKQFTNLALTHGETKTVFLKTAELASLDCQTLAIIDSKGRNWDIQSGSALKYQL